MNDEGLNDKQISDTLQKKKFAERVKFVLTEGKISETSKEVGHTLLFIAEKLPVTLNSRLGLLLKYVLSGKLHDNHQIEYALKVLKDLGDKQITDKEFEEAAGVQVY